MTFNTRDNNEHSILFWMEKNMQKVQGKPNKQIQKQEKNRHSGDMTEGKDERGIPNWSPEGGSVPAGGGDVWGWGSEISSRHFPT